MLVICIALILLLGGAVQLYDMAQMYREIHEAEEKKIELLKEQEELETRKKELTDPEFIEKKARDELGMVKPGEVPYVK